MAKATFSVEVVGLDRIGTILDRLPAQVAGPIMRDALQAAAEPVLAVAAANIRSKSGKTAAALRIALQVDPKANRGVASIGAGKRTYILRWLEFGTQPHPIQGGSEDARLARRAARALRRIGARGAASTLKIGIATGQIRVRHNLKLPNGIIRRVVHHPGARIQAPLTRALASMAQATVKTFGRRTLDGIQSAIKRVPGAI